MNESQPKPMEYELDHGDQPKPETEAEALARMQREDEERARQLGLVREKGQPVGKKWADGIGGNSANATALRLLEQEARAAERKRAARAALTKTIIVAGVMLVILAGGIALACDYMGVLRLGIVSREAPQGSTPAAPAAAEPPRQAVAAVEDKARTAARPAIKVLAVAGQAQPDEAPVGEMAPTPTVRGPVAESAPDLAEQKRAQKRIDDAARAVQSVKDDLAEKQAHIEDNLRGLYGIVPQPRDQVPARAEWRSPCAMLTLEQATATAKRTPNPSNQLAQSNAQAAVNNLNSHLAHNRSVEKSILDRLKAAEKRLATAKAAQGEVP